MPALNPRKIHTLDASGKTLGRLAAAAARLLQGKHKPVYAPNRDVGDIVVIVNLSRLAFSGRKMKQKRYFHYSGYPGGLRRERLDELWRKDPAAVLRRAVTQMLPSNTWRRKWLARLRVGKV